MATRSRIAIENEDGTVSSIYCHWDGYLSNNGRILANHYTDRKKVEALIALGAISSLRENVSPPGIFDDHEDEDVKRGAKLLEKSGVFKTSHTFETPIEGVTVAYHRDRGEDYRAPRVDESVEEYFKSDIEEYGYLFTKEGVWQVKSYDGLIETLDDALADES